MVSVPSKSDIKKRYESAIPIVPGRYKDGVAKTTGFVEKAVAGQELFEAKMTDPTVLARRASALGKLSDSDWKAPAMDKGAARIGPGMRAAIDKQAEKFEPYRVTIEGLSLPDRTTDPMANVDNRVKPIVSALVAKKKEILG